MWPCLRVCAVQLQALMRTIWVHAVPVLGVVMALIAIWSLLLSGVRSSGLPRDPPQQPVATQGASQQLSDAQAGLFQSQ